MAEEEKMEVAPPAPEPAKDIAEEKALVVAEGTSVQVAPWLGAEELWSDVLINLFHASLCHQMVRSLQLQTAHTEEVLLLFIQACIQRDVFESYTACRQLMLHLCSFLNLDAFLERVATEKRISLIKAWEENEKAKAENK
jgi:hypothetical protein